MAAARRRQGQQLYAWHGTPSRRSQATPPFPLTPADEATQPQPPTGEPLHTGVALKREIEVHMDAEGEIAREQVRGET